MGVIEGPMTGRTVVITGASSGLGLASARALAAGGATVVMLNRDLEKSEVVIEQLTAETGGSFDLVLVDLASFDSVRRGAAQLLRRHPAIDVLMLNAGIIAPSRAVTEDGHELTYQVNHLSHFLLAALVRDALSARPSGRLITVSSEAHRQAMTLPMHDLDMSGRWAPYRAYAASKLENILFAREATRRLGPRVTSNALHPGTVRTAWGLEGRGPAWWIWKTALRPVLSTPERGADTQVWLASAPEAALLDGAYVSGRRPVRPSALGTSESLARQLWEMSEEATGESWPAARADERALS